MLKVPYEVMDSQHDIMRRAAREIDITLDTIRDAAEAKYGSLDIEVGERVVRLLNPLRLSKAKREAMVAIQDASKDDDADQEASMLEMIRLAAATPFEAELLIEAIGGDLAVLAEVFTHYGKKTQAGEASA